MELKAGKVTKGTNLAVLKFLMPSHLDSFQLAFVGLFRIVLEFGQFGDVAVQVGEADGKGVEVWMPLGQQNSQVFSVVPGKFLRQS